MDCNNFFVSCERSVNPALDGVPVVVLSNNDGCVVARSNESKRMGVRMGQPAFEIKDLISSGKILALSGNHLFYREKSMRVHDIFRRFVPTTIDYSVDESFLDVNGIPLEALGEIGDAIYAACREEERIPVTIGFAPTKTLAKITTEVGKKRGERVTVHPVAEDLFDIMEKIPIWNLWGMGRKLSKRMYGFGVTTIGDFRRKPLVWVRKQLGVVGERSWLELNGTSCIELEHVSRPLQDSISETRTFPEDVDDFDYLRARIVIYCADVCRRLRKMEGVCGALTVFLRTNRFHIERGCYSPEITVEFDPGVDDTSVVASAAIEALKAIYNPAFKYKRAGVVLSKITGKGVSAPSLFDNVQEENLRIMKHGNLMKTIDRLNSDVSRQTLKLASELTKSDNGHNDGYSSSFGAPK